MNFETMMFSLPAIIIGLTVHEYAHAFTAMKLGDDTAKSMGRVSLNPLTHIDPVGLIFIIVAGFGWAKPVQFNPAKLSHPRRDAALIAVAGPLSNLLLGLAALFAVRAFRLTHGFFSDRVFDVLFYTLFYMGFINLGLFVFNMLPIPPLDGSHVFFSAANMDGKFERALWRFAPYVLFAVILFENRSGYDILPIGWVVERIARLALGW